MEAGTVLEVEGYQEGSRWVHQRPTGAEFGKWFRENVKLHGDLSHDDYLPGLTLIPQSEDIWATVVNDRGFPEPQKAGKQQVYIPYAKVETRVAYFWDWLHQEHPDAVARFVPVGPSEGTLHAEPASAIYSGHLPPGFFTYLAAKGDGRFDVFVGCTYVVRIFEKSLAAGEAEGRLILESPQGTKIVPQAGRYGTDQNALMKAETGAIGRALGMMGMLVIPGSGVATAEDMQEHAAQAAAAPAEPKLPDDTGKKDQLAPAAAGGSGPEPAETPKEEALRKLADLESLFPERYEQLQEWAKGRRMNFNDLQEPQLRGLLRKLDKEIAEGEVEAADKAAQEEQAPGDGEA